MSNCSSLDMSVSLVSLPLFDFEFGFVKSSQVHHALLVASAASAVLAWAGLSLFRWGSRAPPQTPVVPTPAEKPQPQPQLTAPIIHPLLDFHYARNPPPAFRPYKPKYHFTMGLQANPTNELCLLDTTYRARIAYRRHLISTHPTVLGHLPTAASAVQEFYSFLLTTYLPYRYPTHFSLTPSGTLLHNHVTTQTHPVVPPSTRSALKTLGENLDDDFILLQPDAEGVYRVGAFVMCFPSGFEMSEKLGWPMSQIHEQVPGLESRLGTSIERFFGKLQPGVNSGVRRLNWGITRTSELYTPAGNHVYQDAEQDMGRADEVDAETCCLRVERQTLWKLPQTGAIAFGIKTYITPLKEIKAEGGAAALIEAIEGLGDEGAPLATYKGRDVWGEKVLEYLRA